VLHHVAHHSLVHLHHPRCRISRSRCGDFRGGTRFICRASDGFHPMEAISA
jgi:hypothetical protein